MTAAGPNKTGSREKAGGLREETAGLKYFFVFFRARSVWPTRIFFRRIFSGGAQKSPANIAEIIWNVGKPGRAWLLEDGADGEDGKDRKDRKNRKNHTCPKKIEEFCQLSMFLFCLAKNALHNYRLKRVYRNK
ncbi:MAG: hypothetical protein LBO05_06610 [Deltaproteobacteria bacterium]|nr:hypothetical protein [Deltaproteobacteria bacterium]